MLFPEMIRVLPAADVGLAGVDARVIQAADHQLVFMRFATDVEVPEHAHAAQWGVVLDGEIELTIAGERRILRRGDNYVIPAGVVHGSRVRRGYKDVTLFAQRDRYPVMIRSRDVRR